MPRWEPDAGFRLERAAIELFAEQGYDDTTIEQIAAAAGLTRSTFFRHFGDKRGILFGGHDGLPNRLAAIIQGAPPEQTPLEALETALADIGSIWFSWDRRDLAPHRLAVVDSNPELRERELLKRRAMADALVEGLRARGVGELPATVAAELAMLSFARTIVAWAAPDNTEEFAVIAIRVLRQLRDAAGDLK